MRQWILLFVVVDAIIVLIVVWWLMTKRARLQKLAPGPNLAQLAGFTRDVEPQIREYMAAFYGGDPATLAQVLPGLVTRLRSQAEAAGMGLSAETLEAIVARVLATERIARERDVHRAFEDARSGGR